MKETPSRGGGFLLNAEDLAELREHGINDGETFASLFLGDHAGWNNVQAVICHEGQELVSKQSSLELAHPGSVHGFFSVAVGDELYGPEHT